MRCGRAVRIARMTAAISQVHSLWSILQQTILGGASSLVFVDYSYPSVLVVVNSNI